MFFLRIMGGSKTRMFSSHIFYVFVFFQGCIMVYLHIFLVSRDTVPHRIHVCHIYLHDHVGKYDIHGSYGYRNSWKSLSNNGRFGRPTKHVSSNAIKWPNRDPKRTGTWEGFTCTFGCEIPANKEQFYVFSIFMS